MAPHGVPELVSVIVPTYDRVHFLEDALDSVRDQTYRPIELLIVDDGSTDATKEVVRSWQARHAASEEDFSVRYIHQPNSGAPVARNRGLVASHGAFIQYLDSDDALHPQKLEIHVALLQSDIEQDYAWSGWRVRSDFTPYGPHHASEYNVAALLDGVRIVRGARAVDIASNTWSGLYRREACWQIGPWNESLRRWQDVEYNARFALLNPSCVHADALLYQMRNHADGRINDYHHNAAGIAHGLEALRIIEHTYQQAGADASSLLRGFYFKLVQLALQEGRAAQVRAVFRGAARQGGAWPFRAKLMLLRIAFRVLGVDAARRLLQAYSRLAFRLAGEQRSSLDESHRA